ncbi:MAG: DivIVA domain-containing protein [Thermoleophilia bacterium]|nr:DivIVA domain-containing protein [Thermoleophilia bacterium]
MTITPVEIRHVRLRRGLAGYRTTATKRLLEQIVASYEEAWRERADLRDEVERLEGELARFRDLERLLRDTMMSAERAAEDLRTQGRREYELTVQEARLKAREIVDAAEAERERHLAEIRRLQAARAAIRADLETALGELAERPELEDTGELRLPGQAA